jgi:hypothetical protein
MLEMACGQYSVYDTLRSMTVEVFYLRRIPAWHQDRMWQTYCATISAWRAAGIASANPRTPGIHFERDRLMPCERDCGWSELGQSRMLGSRHSPLICS